MTFPDCLVLKIEEYDISKGKLDTSMFVLYDQVERQYIVRGARTETKKLNSVPYSFRCEQARDLADFISVAVCKENRMSYVLYNYKDLPLSTDDITYDMLYGAEYPSNEVAAYDNMRYNRKTLLKYLGMLKNVFNYY
jgi:hypothetical protein